MKKNMIQQKTCLLAAWTLLIGLYIFYTVPVQAEANLVKNGSFENLQNGDGIPAFWSTASWLTDNEAAKFKTEQGEAYDGKHYVTIVSQKPNHARFLQKIDVEPDTFYKVYCYIKTKNVAKLEKAKGANINIETRIETSAQIFDTTDAWKYTELYVHTGKDIHEITIALALGGYYGDAAGKASFDQVSMIKLNAFDKSSLAPGTPLCMIGEVEANPKQEQQQQKEQQQVQPEKKESAKPMQPLDSRSVMYILFIFIILFLLSRLVYYNRKKLTTFLKVLFKKLITKRKKPQINELNPNQNSEGQ